MKIAMVTPYLPPRLGGREFWVLWMSRELVKQGVNVAVFASNVSDYYSSACRSETIMVDGVTIHKQAVLFDINKYSTPILLPPLKLLKRERPDVVHLHEPNLFLTTPLAFYAKYILKKPVITHCYSDPFDWYGGGILFRLAMSLYGWIYDWKLRLSDHIIVISEAYLNTSRYLPKYRNKVTVLPMCLAPVFRVLPILEVNEFRRDLVGPDRKMVLYVGRVDHRKGIDFLIRAMQSIDAKCVIVGKGEKGAEFALRALTESLNLGNKVIFAGSCDQEELNKYYNACDVLVLPTSDETAETFGAVLLEAWAVAKPVISADNPAPAALIREADAGLLVKREDAMALCGAINRLLTDNGLCMALGQRGYSYVQRRFSFGEVSRRLIELYQRLSKCDERRYT